MRLHSELHFLGKYYYSPTTPRNLPFVELCLSYLDYMFFFNYVFYLCPPPTMADNATSSLLLPFFGPAFSMPTLFLFHRPLLNFISSFCAITLGSSSWPRSLSQSVTMD